MMIGPSQSRFLVLAVAFVFVAIVGQLQGAVAAVTLTGTNFDHQNNNEIGEPKGPDLGHGEQARQNQAQYESISSSSNLFHGNKDNLKQYLLKDLDLDGYTISKPSAEQWRWFQLSKLLDQISSSIPTPAPPQLAPIYRTGRTYPSVGGYSSGYALASGSGDYSPPPPRAIPTLRLTMPQVGSPTSASNNIYQSDQKNQRARKQSVLGIDWTGSRPTGSSALVTVRRSQSLNGPTAMDRGHQHHTIGTGEVALHTPMHSRSTNDYEWKRVENLSKWNNLRGMWGKRAASSMPMADSMEEQQEAEAAAAATTMGYQFTDDRK